MGLREAWDMYLRATDDFDSARYSVSYSLVNPYMSTTKWQIDVVNRENGEHLIFFNKNDYEAGLGAAL